MYEHPLLSIITINRNRKDDLEATFNSVFSQPTQNFEYIVIDGGSTDGSVELIHQYASRIHYWVSEPDKGIYDAMNKGAQAAQGKYLLFLNGGDTLYTSDILTQALDMLGRQDQDIVAYNVGKELAYGRVFIFRPPEQFYFRDFFERWIPHCSTCIRRTVFMQIGMYDTSMRIVADWKFFILALCKYDATYVHLDLALSRFQYGGISGKKEMQALIEQERRSVLETYFKLFYEDILTLVHWKKQVKLYTGYTFAFNILRWGRRTIFKLTGR